MCAIVGALVQDAHTGHLNDANRLLARIFETSSERGRDGRGFHVHDLPYGRLGDRARTYRDTKRSGTFELPKGETFFETDCNLAAGSLIGNLRAEPTTEYVEHKRLDDQQPYSLGQWTIVHNGTIANDKEIRWENAVGFKPAMTTSIDSAAIVELLARDDMIDQSSADVAVYFAKCIKQLKGSYAILAVHAQHPGMMLVACNYRPIWYGKTTYGVFFTSSEYYLPSSMAPQMVEPYSCWAFTATTKTRLDVPATPNKRALVVCSGGMDSVVAATWAKRAGYEIVLLHFRYGSRAEGPEEAAIWKIAEYFKCGVWFQNMDIYSPDDSPLLRKDDTIAGGEEGAEFAHEWVPARNLVMLSLATAMAEARKLDTIILGNNLEEAGAYPDNEPEFIKRFNEVLPFAVGDGKHIQVIMPVGNLMKHEIVALGTQIDAPLHLTWSCYRAGEHHCGTCGPCHMRRTAFAINNLPEVITYEETK